MNDYLTTPEVAKISNRHKQTVWRDVRRRILPAKLIGGIYLISLKDVQVTCCDQKKLTANERRPTPMQAKEKELAQGANLPSSTNQGHEASYVKTTLTKANVNRCRLVTEKDQEPVRTTDGSFVEFASKTSEQARKAKKEAEKNFGKCKWISTEKPFTDTFGFFEETPVKKGFTLEDTKPVKAKPPKSSANDEQEEKSITELIEEYGEPASFNDRGNIIRLHEPFFSALLKQEFTRLLFEPAENRFYFYDSTDGLFKDVTANSLKHQALKMLLHVQKNFSGYQDIARFNTDRYHGSLVNVLKGMVEEREAFKRQYGLIHTANCMLVFDETTGKFEPKEFSQEYRSRNASEFKYLPEATCPEFNKRILGHILEEDRHLIQEYAGQCLLGDNLSQTILLLVGVGGSSKGALVRIIKGVVGEKNSRELRTKHVENRFEIGMYLGKTLLIGSDVKSDFLVDKVKSLSGSDTLEAETKGSSIQKTIEGRFNIIATSNEDMTVDLDGDSSAWDRRLRLVCYEKPFVGEKIPDIEMRLLKSEGSGILNWCIEGDQKLLVKNGNLLKTELQQKRITNILQSSDSLKLFLQENLMPDSHISLATEDIVSAYADFCRERNWMLLPDVEGKLPKLMLELFCSTPCRNVMQPGKLRFCRGYLHVKFNNETYECFMTLETLNL